MRKETMPCQETSSSKPTAFVGSHFDVDQVNQMLDSKKLSQSATKFKGLFETFNKGHPNGAAGNSNQPQSLDDLLSSSQTAKELQIMSLMSGHLPKRQLPQAAKGISSGSVEVANPAESSNLKISQCEKCSSDLQAIERRIMQRLSQMEQTQNEKFDQLTQLIQSIKKRLI